MPDRHSLIREGLIAGAIGATAVALWFLVADTLSGQPLHTPAVLGQALFSVFGPTTHDRTSTHIVFYTLFHYAAFAAVGLLATFVVHRAETEPTVLAVFLILFVVFELAFYGLAAILAQTLMTELAWYRVAAGNLIAAVLMGTYLWRRHPSLRQDFAHALGGTE